MPSGLAISPTLSAYPVLDICRVLPGPGPSIPPTPAAYPTPRPGQTLPSTTPYMAPRREIHIGGNRGEGRLTLSESQ